MQRRALIVGAGSGIGRATARLLAARGVDVVVSGRREAPLRELADELRDAHDVQASWLAGDSGDPDTAERVVDHTVQTLGGIDVCVCAAGAFKRMPFEELDGESWREGLRNTLDPAVFVSAAAARRMLAGGGRIVLVSSVDDRASEPQAAAYNAAKAATTSLVRSMAVDLAARGIQTNGVAPGLVRSEMTEKTLARVKPGDLKRANLYARPGEPEEIGNVIVYLALDAPEFLVGETILVDGGLMAQTPML